MMAIPWVPSSSWIFFFLQPMVNNLIFTLFNVIWKCWEKWVSSWHIQLLLLLNFLYSTYATNTHLLTLDFLPLFFIFHIIHSYSYVYIKSRMRENGIRWWWWWWLFIFIENVKNITSQSMEKGEHIASVSRVELSKERKEVEGRRGNDERKIIENIEQSGKGKCVALFGDRLCIFILNLTSKRL